MDARRMFYGERLRTSMGLHELHGIVRNITCRVDLTSNVGDPLSWFHGFHGALCSPFFLFPFLFAVFSLIRRVHRPWCTAVASMPAL